MQRAITFEVEEELDAALNWDGSRVYVIGSVTSDNPEIRIVDANTGKQTAKQVFKELRKSCETGETRGPAPPPMFEHLTFVSKSSDFAVGYCGSLYVIDGDDLRVKASFAAPGISDIIVLPESKKMVVTQSAGAPSASVYDFTRWKQETSWPLARGSQLVPVGNEELAALVHTSEGCKLAVLRLQDGFVQREMPLGTCTGRMRLFGAPKSSTVAAVDSGAMGVLLSLWDIAQGTKLSEATLEGSDALTTRAVPWPTAIAVSQDLRWVVGDRAEKELEFQVWDASSGKERFRSGVIPKRGSGLVNSMAKGWAFLAKNKRSPVTYFQLSGDGRVVLMDISAMTPATGHILGLHRAHGGLIIHVPAEPIRSPAGR